MKKIFLLMALCCGVMVANAQISTGESTSKVIRTGNRAKAGNYGLYLGATSEMFKKLGDGGTKFSALPLINLKYMYTDQTEFRLGIEWWKSKTTEEDFAEGAKNDDGSPKATEHYTSEKSYMFYPGIAYHFNSHNLLDVYVGGEMPFGFGNEGAGNKDDDAYISQFRFGLGAFIGLQAYIANLPIAIGCEYGIQGLYAHTSEGKMTADKMTIDNTTWNKDFSQSKFKLGQQVRFTLTYYFDL